jgi:hypothetical protein
MDLQPDLTEDVFNPVDSVPAAVLTTERERFKADWYDKKHKQNSIIKRHLIDIINQYKGPGFPWTTEELKELGYEDLLEIAVPVCNKHITITLGAEKDWSNFADGKVSIVRKNGKECKSYSALVSGCKNKKHIFCCVYEGIQQKFYYFSFPVSKGQHTIPFNPITGEPATDNYMWNFECKTFEEMANSL